MPDLIKEIERRDKIIADLQSENDRLHGIINSNPQSLKSELLGKPVKAFDVMAFEAQERRRESIFGSTEKNKITN